MPFQQLPPLALYIHFPWCVRKCPYCDFNSHPLKNDLPETQYIAALLSDLEHDLPRVWGRRLRTIFMGGGTPSLFSPESIDTLLAGIRARIPLHPEAEITLEANPGASDAEKFAGYRAAGVNRLSIGIQSFDNEKLTALGRIHDSTQAVAAAQAARAAGFDNFNLDLMIGLPQQSVEQAEADVRSAIELNPTHLSVYQLTLEPNTPFHAQPPALPDEEQIAMMQDRTRAVLAAGGFAQYEVSAYAQASRQCRHNRNYWEYGDYLGIGAGAHAKITDARGIVRLAKRKQPRDFLAQAGSARAIAEMRDVTAADAAFEFMLNALRLTDGVPAMLFTDRTGMPLAVIDATMEKARARGLLAPDSGLLRATEHGQKFLNDLVELFLPEPHR